MLPAPADAASRRNLAVKIEPAIQAPQGQRTILISLRKQRLRLFDNGREIASTRISSGKPGFDTPAGVFSILEKKTYHESNIYDGAPMPFMQRITWSGIAMHAGVVPGYRASHGCVRLPASFAKTFFSKTDVGGRVIITQDEVNPLAFDHATLFKPLPEHDPVPQEAANAAEPRVAASDATEAGKAALSNIVGNAAAAAAPGETQPQTAANAGKARSRAEVARRFAAKLENLQTAMKTAEDKKIAASEKAKAAVRAAQEAESRLSEIRRPFEDVLRTAAAAQAARANAARVYRDFLAKSGVKAAPEPQERRNAKTRNSRDRDKDAERERERQAAAMPPEEREQELEDRLLDASVDADAAKAAAAQGEATIAQAKAAFDTAEAEKQRAIEEVRTAVVDLRTAQTALVDARAEATRRNRPLSIFISLKSQRLFIRQGFEPIFEAPIEVDDPPGAIGTHVLTALGYDETGNNFKWQLVNAQPPRPVSGAIEASGKKNKRERETMAVSANSPLSVEAARVALDAIRIPPDVQEQISELARPGTSLIISEKDLSRETGKGTEFVILTR